MTGQDAVGNVEMGLHRLVVGDALGVVALYDTLDFVRGLDGFLLDNFVVADNVEDDFRRHNGETRDFGIGEELVRHLDDSLHADLLRGVVESDGDGGLQVEESQEAGHLIGLGSGYVVDNGAVLNGSNEAFFLVHLTNSK